MRRGVKGVFGVSVAAALAVVVAALSAAGDAKEKKPEIDLKGKKVVMIIAHRNYRDEELAEPKAILEECGARVVVASTSLKPARGMLKGTVKPDVLLKDVKAKEYDAVVFVGGAGATAYFEDKTAQDLAKEAVKEEKVVAAICIAPCILAKAGVLKHKQATCWASRKHRRIMEKAGARFTSKDVVRDGRFLTANGPKAAKRFGRLLAKMLAEHKDKDESKKG